MKKVIGYYNKSRYYIEVDGKEVYEAGNSPFDSQAYVMPENGVGLRTMRRYCMSTTKDIAEEQKNGEYAGVQRIEEEERL